MKIFNILNASIENVNFIEASAGTGKTYTLEGLYLRLLLEKELTPNQILVVTFTRAATEELKDRIRKKMVLLKEALLSNQCDEPFVQQLVKRIGNRNKAFERVQTGLVDFDMASIYTIHGFCQRVLNENAFETDNLFESDVLTDPMNLYSEIARDFWRKHFYEAPRELIIHELDNKISGPEFFISLLQNCRHPHLRIIPENIAEPSLEILKDYRSLFTEIRNNWIQYKETVLSLLKDPCLNGTRYGTLQASSKDNKFSKREMRIRGLVSEMDQFTSNISNGYPVFNKFDLFRQREITRLTKKGQSPPQHQFFQLCDTFFDQYSNLKVRMDRYRVFLKSQFLKFAGARLTEEQNKTNHMRFDDLLLMVNQALDGREGIQLANRLRDQYRAVLVDEFQDTDSIQFDIFSRLFRHKDTPLFLIGDPKQAIYGFRGADIYSYLDAVRDSGEPFTLLTNYRSDPPLIQAVNSIFSQQPHPFLFKDIVFESVSSGTPEINETTLSPAPMVLWHLLFEKEKKPLSQTDATRLIVSAMADEILNLTRNPKMGPGFGDIAVLVRTNRQAKIVQEKFSEKKIPAVIYQSGNIFSTYEAMEIHRLLMGIVFHNDNSRIKAAVATSLLGGDGNSEDFIEESGEWEKRLSKVKKYAFIWKDQGFMRMFSQVMAEENVKSRLMRFPDGDRRLTNILHLIELLHQATIEEKLDSIGLVKWLNEKRQTNEGDTELHLLRLESDANAVNILTIHKCKGLEFPIVFCPFSWDSFVHRSETVEFHDPEYQNRLTMDLGSENKEKNAVQAQNEQMAENLRLLYVALTRARKKCYLAWGGIKNTETSAPAYLFHFDGEDTSDVIGALKACMLNKSNNDLLADLNRLADSADNTISIGALPGIVRKEITTESKVEPSLVSMKFSSSINRDFQISSYSSLTTSDRRDYVFFERGDQTGEKPLPEFNSVMFTQTMPAKQVFSDILDFPRGTRAGIFFHDIFEQIEFSEKDDQVYDKIVREKLLQYGFDPRWQSVICKMIRNVLSTILLEISPEFSLSFLSAKHKINEMEFYFPVDYLTPKIMADCFYNFASPNVPENYHHQIGMLKFIPFWGYMKGFADLIFHYNHRYYIVDWKSNHLGSTLHHYTGKALSDAMAHHHYVLQYHLYVLALHRYLKIKMPSYCYEKQFGGVFYLFIRGMEPEKGCEYGVYFDRPEKVMIEMLEQTLISGHHNPIFP